MLSDNFSHIKRIRTDRWKGVRKGGRGKTIARKKESEKVEEEARDALAGHFQGVAEKLCMFLDKPPGNGHVTGVNPFSGLGSNSIYHQAVLQNHSTTVNLP